jgi:hypothetical protein
VFRSLATDLTLKIVGELWEDQGFAPIPSEELKYQDSEQDPSFLTLCGSMQVLS